MRYSCFIIFFLLLSADSWAQSGLSEHLATLEHAKGDSQKIAAYQSLIRYYSRRSNDSITYYADRAIAYCKQHNYRLGEGIIIAQLAVIDENQGRRDLSKQRNLQALAIYREHDFRQGIADVLGNIGAIEAEKGNFNEGIRYLIASLKLNDSLGNAHGLMMAYMNIGSLYVQQGDTTNATKYLDHAEEVSKQLPLSDKVIALYNMIGVTYAIKGNTTKALEYLLNDLKLSDKPQFVDSHVECLLYLGNFYHDMGDMPKAMQYLQDGLKIAEDRKLPELRSNILLEIAMLTKEKDPRAAMHYLNQALEIASGMGNRSFMTSVYAEMAVLHKQLGNYKEALYATEQKQQITDSIFSMNKAREMASITASYELERSNIKVKDLQIQSNKNASERNMVLFIAAAIVIILIVLWIFYRKTILLNRQLKEHEEELKELNNMKDKFFSIIGHDLRAPIARIPAILDIYEDAGTTGEEKQYLLNSLREHSKSSMEMLDKLLFWGQSLVKGIRIQEQYIFLKEYIRDNIELKKMAAEEKSIEIEDTTPEDLRVFADATHCDFIVRNLLTNAIKYTHTNGRIEISTDRQSKPGFTIFSIKDNGIGIEKDRIPEIFHPLYSVTGTANEKGTGIGLMLCKEFAIQNGGDIWVESEVGKGSIFYFSLRNAA